MLENVSNIQIDHTLKLLYNKKKIGQNYLKVCIISTEAVRFF